MATPELGLISRIWPFVGLCWITTVVSCRTSSFSEKSIAFVRTGETTRAEVIENLGPPHFEAKEHMTLGYTWETVAGTESAPVLRREQSLPIITTETSERGRVKHALCFQFDEAGRVNRYQKIAIRPGQAADAAMLEWSRSGQVR